MIIIYQSIVTPYRLWFDVPANGFFEYLEIIMDIVFAMDIIANFNTGYYHKGVVVMKRHKIIINYLASWFLIDVIATFPYEYTIEIILTDGNNSNSSLEQYSEAPQLLRMLKLIRFLRILRLLRVMKLKKLLYKLEEYMVTEVLNTLMDFLKLIVLIFFISHWMGCVFYFIGDYEKADNPENWITIEGFEKYTKFEQYTMCLYYSFSTMTTVGYGDITPNTNLEKCYGMLGMIIACGFSAYLIGSIGYIFNRSNMLANEYKLKSLHMNQFLMHKEIPNDFRLKIMTYMQYLIDYKQRYKLEENEVLDMLNENLKEQVIAFLNGRVLMECWWFDYFSKDLLSEATFILTRKMFSVDDHLFDEENIGNTMYFITKG